MTWSRNIQKMIGPIEPEFQTEVDLPDRVRYVQDVPLDVSEIPARIAVMRTAIKLARSNLQVFWQPSELRPFKARWSSGRGEYRQRNYSTIERLESFVSKDAHYAVCARVKRASKEK